jgi:hypothetical protein
MKVQKLEERWTPTTVQTAFVFHSLPSKSRVSIDFPLPNLGWTFTLSLTSKNVLGDGRCKWIPAKFSFRQQGSAIPWGSTSIHAQLSLAVEQKDCGSVASPAEECTPHNDMGSNLISLGTMNVVLAQTSSLELPTTTRCTVSSLRPNKVWLTVTISECPLANGLFQASSGPVNEAEVQAQLVRQSGSRSLATGKLFDVKFLTFSTSGNTGRLLPTYASLSVLKEHVNFSCE